MPTGSEAAFFGQQTEIRAADRAQMALPAFVNFIDLSPAIGDFVDTAAIIANLDLVIAVDTSVKIKGPGSNGATLTQPRFYPSV
jgi:ADP-heptose:LPS heptosyltransferase